MGWAQARARSGCAARVDRKAFMRAMDGSDRRTGERLRPEHSPVALPKRNVTCRPDNERPAAPLDIRSMPLARLALSGLTDAPGLRGVHMPGMARKRSEHLSTPHLQHDRPVRRNAGRSDEPSRWPSPASGYAIGALASGAAAASSRHSILALPLTLSDGTW